MKKLAKIAVALLVLLIIGITLFFVIALGPVSKTKSEVTFVVEGSRIDIAKDLKKAGLVKSKVATLAYIFFNPKMNLQAGKYTIDRSMSTPDIIKKISNGEIDSVNPTVRITFVEGKRLVDYAKRISENFDITEEEFIKTASDKEFLQELIKEYWFLDESILDEKIYYPLEGYLAPNTYEFYKTADAKTIIKRMLASMSDFLTPYKEDIEKSKYSIHELLTIASICEKEAVNADGREKVAQVVYKRLDLGMSLGMDVTSYYGVFKDMKEEITAMDLAADNAYNTRNSNFKGLPASAICSPSRESINAALHPADTNYVYFVADLKTGEVYFAETYEEFIKHKGNLGL